MEKTVETKRILYIPSDFAKENLLYLQECGTSTALKIHQSSRNKLSSFLLFVVLKGNGYLEYQGNHYKLRQGECVFIDCLSPYIQQTSKDLWTISWIHFNGENMRGIYEKYKKRGGNVTFVPTSFEPICNLLNEIYDIANLNSSIRDMKINAKIAELLSLIMSESSPSKANSAKKSIGLELAKIKDCLDTNWSKDVKLDELAKQFYVNKFYLLRQFEKEYGKSVKRYLIEKRIMQAKKLLRFSNFSLEEISSQSGFNDPNYFSRKFKSIEGSSPSDYRKQWIH